MNNHKILKEQTFFTFFHQASTFKTITTKKLDLMRGHRYYLDTLLVRKISKRHFLKDIENSFQEVTQIGPEPHHFFSFSNISTNRVARDFQNFGRNGP